MPSFEITDDAFADHMAAVLLVTPAAIAVAVSGGADSLALTLLLDQWCRARQVRLHALTVDHRLRAESTAEALWVQKTLQDRGVTHTILTWDHEQKPTSRLQERARNARYALMEAWCLAHDVPVLMTAHHAQDVAETFFQRLARGSGLTGLCGMAPCLKRPSGLIIARPLLGAEKSDLLYTCQSRFECPHVEDPSNKNEAFDRIRWRQLMPQLADQGLTAAILQKTIQRLIQAEGALQQVVEAHVAQMVTRDALLGVVTLDGGGWISDQALHPEYRYRILQHVVGMVNQRPYPMPQEVVCRLDAYLQSGIRRKYTAGGCVFLPQKGVVRAVKEYRQPLGSVLYEDGMVWGDFILNGASSPEEKWVVQPMSAAHAARWAIHPTIGTTLPMLVDEQGRACSPLFDTGCGIHAKYQGLPFV